MGARYHLRLTSAAAVALVVAAAGCGSTPSRPSPRPAPPLCLAGQVAEWDDDGWECEPDVNPRNGIDDEDDRRHGRTSHVLTRPQTTSPRLPSARSTQTASQRPISSATRRSTTAGGADRASERRSSPSSRRVTTRK
ncbi:hypothetical protein FrEUN1fDRAFT_7880 [Parafrankia sp. EUN1f]|nr:hypothetical protein FrEUN1fDRAFT_7880 [Parafrankia sp. EUN1f]